MMQRRVGQHYSQVRIARGNAFGDVISRLSRPTFGRCPESVRVRGVSASFFQQHDRCAMRNKHCRFFLGYFAMQPHFVQGCHHQGKRPVGPALAPAQPGHGFGVCGIDDQLKTAQSFYRQNAVLQHHIGRDNNRFFGPGNVLSRRVKQFQARAALRAGDGLGVKTPIGGILVLLRGIAGTWRIGPSRSEERSYGNCSMIDQRGPQFVQFVNG